jgi:spore photoproduct lyase
MTAIAHIYIDKTVANLPQVATILKRFNTPTSIVEQADELYQHIRSAPDPILAGKKHLFLTTNKGNFVRNCPGTRNYACCDYMILHIGTFCTMDCAYCILQSYFHPPVLQFFVNHDALFQELDAFLLSGSHRRIGTGEYTDSLIWELWSDLSHRLIRRFAEQSHAVLELKTKTTNVDQIIDLPHKRRTILAWSLNTPAMIRQHERGTASLDARINTAARCQAKGYPIAFHFDPIVEYEGCVEEYAEVVGRIFRKIAPENIVWISLGTLRFMPDLKPIIQKRFPESKMTYGEFIPGMDGKSRYFKPIRIELYKKIVRAIRTYAPETTVYFCMESEDVWKHVFGDTPDNFGGVGKLLDMSAVNICGLDA